MIAIVFLWLASILVAFMAGIFAGHADADRAWQRDLERARKYRDA